MTAIQHNAPVQSAAHTTSAPQAQHNASWKGFQVQSIAHGAVKAADMAEEMALSVASLSADKSIKKKQVEEKKDKKVSANAELMPGLPLYEAEVFVRALNQQGKQDAQSIRQLVQKFFRDPTLQDAALRFAQEHLSQEDPQHARIHTVRQALQDQFGADIRAGYNIASIELHELSAQQARDCYRFHVLNYQSYEKTFSNLMQEPHNPENTVAFLRKALGADMQALQPSCSEKQLHEVAEGLYMVQNLTNLYTQAKDLCTSTAKRFSSTEPEAHLVMQGLLSIKDNTGITEPTLRRQLSFLASKNPTRDAVFVRGVREIARTMPTKLYTTEEQRQKVLHVLQQNLDKAIEREEALEE